MGGRRSLSATQWPDRLLAVLVAVVLTAAVLTGDRVPDRGSGADAPGSHDMPMVQPSPAASAPTAAPLDRAGWTVSATSASEPAAQVLDGRDDTIWHSAYDADLPQAITVDTGRPQSVSGLVYQPRQDRDFNGIVVRYSVDTSVDGTVWEPGVRGTWAGDSVNKTVTFDVRPARYVRLTAQASAGNTEAATNRFATAAEIDLLGEPLGPTLSRSAWAASATSEDPTHPAADALDGDDATYWRSGGDADHPHRLSVDLGSPRVVSGLWATPLREQSGRIVRYAVTVSDDGQEWRRVAVGAWPDPATGSTPDGVVSFVPVTTRHVRLTSRSGRAGDRSASVAELDLFGAPPTPTLRRDGWRASASSSQPGNGPGRVLDGQSGTAWQADPRPAGQRDGQPQAISLDLRVPYRVSSLRYTPAPGASQPQIRRYAVSASSDGRSWRRVAASTWPASAGAQTAYFPRITARHVRLIALSTTGGRARAAAVAELDVSGEPTPGVRAAALGSWGEVIGFPIVPASAVLLPRNRVLGFSAFAKSRYDVDDSSRAYTQIAILDLDTGRVKQREIRNTGHEMFCTGLSLLADGRVLITGGSGPSNTTVYDPDKDTWSRGAQMQIPRGYQSTATLSTGQVFTLGGSWSGGEGGKDGELWTRGDGWERLPGITADPILTDDRGGVFRADNHGWFFGWKDGTVFHAGPSDQMNWFDTADGGGSAPAGIRADGTDAMNGNAVMYDAGRILTLGGAANYSGTEASVRASTIDIRGGSGAVSTSRTGDMAHRRAFSNSVVLPDGQVLVVGGQEFASPFSDARSVRVPEIWSPATGEFTELAPEAIARTYHSAALLLPDGRVFSGGGGLCQDPCSIATNHLDGQIFTPPYLYTAAGKLRARPRITSAPRTADHGQRMPVRVTAAGAPVTEFSLVRYGSATHSVNTDQRRIAVSSRRTGAGRFSVTVPPNPGVAVPGDYLLFAIDADGTPSVAATVRID